MKLEHIEFIEANMINFETVKLGYTRQIPIEILQMYERIYHENIDPSYVLTYWCGGCVFDMMKRLMYFYEAMPREVMPEPTVAISATDLPGEIATDPAPKAKAKKTKK